MQSLHKSILIVATAIAISVPTILVLNANSKTSDHIRAYRQSNLPTIPLTKSLPKIIHFSASTSLQLIAYSEAQQLTTGKWNCIWGTVSPDGQYSFPDQFPPSGFDTITFTDNFGKATTINLAFTPTDSEEFPSEYNAVTPEVHLSRSKVLSPLSQETNPITSRTIHLNAPININSTSSTKSTLIQHQQVNRQNLVLLSSVSSNHFIYTHATQNYSIVKRTICNLSPGQIANLKKLRQPSNATISSPLFYRKLNTPTLKTFMHKFAGGQQKGSYFQSNAVAIQYQDHYKLKSGHIEFIGSTVTQTRGHYGFGFTPTSLGATSTRAALGYNLKGYNFNHFNNSNSSQLQL